MSGMEQYIHTLIPVDSSFVPAAGRVGEFFETLVSVFHYQMVASRRAPAGPVVMKPTDSFRTFTLPSGEVISRPQRSSERPESLAAIAGFIEGAEHYTIQLPGQWQPEHRPIDLFRTNTRALFEDVYLCTASCELRPKAVSTSAWDLEAGPNIRNVPMFGSDCESEMGVGIFPNPWTGEVIEVEHAGCARFWIEFEFGRFIYPKMSKGIEAFNPAIVAVAEKCFYTRFGQGWRFW